MEPMKLSARICEKCAKPLAFALQPGGKGPRSWQCFDCEGPDPITSPNITGWVKGLLGEEPEDSA
jgi:hypothetical protein